MVDKYVNGSIAGDNGTRDYNFSIVKGGHNVGLPQSEIDGLGLKQSVFFPKSMTRDTEGLAGDKSYMATAHFAGSSVELDVLPALAPTVDVAVLRDLGFKVDLGKGSVEEPTTNLDILRGFSPWSSPTGYNRVYVGSADGWVYALSCENLEVELRTRLLAGRTISHLKVANDKVYLALADGWMYALDAGNLDMEWRSRLLEGKSITHLVVADRRVYLALSNGWVYALHAGNLEEEWHTHLLMGRKIAHFSVANGRVYVLLEDGEIYALDAGNLELLWQTTLPEGKRTAHLHAGSN